MRFRVHQTLSVDTLYIMSSAEDCKPSNSGCESAAGQYGRLVVIGSTVSNMVENLTKTSDRGRISGLCGGCRSRCQGCKRYSCEQGTSDGRVLRECRLQYVRLRSLACVFGNDVIDLIMQFLRNFLSKRRTPPTPTQMVHLSVASTM